MSYTPLKTINGQSIKGTGDLTVTGSGVSDGDYGDITVSGSGMVWNIDAATVGVTELSATGTPDNTTFLRGDNTWATPTATDPEGWTTIVKSANQDVTNTITPQDDTALQFSVVAGGHYMIEMIVTYSSNNNAGDYLFDLAVSAGLMKGWGTCIGLSTTNAIQSIVLQASTAADTNNVTLGTPLSDFDGLSQVVINFSFYCDTNATFVYRFANAAASIGRTSRTWKGSILKYKRID